MKKVQWFLDRIGKRVYRDDTTCQCKVCKDVGAHGLIIQDKAHAYYLFDCENEMNIIYRDKP